MPTYQRDRLMLAALGKLSPEAIPQTDDELMQAAMRRRDRALFAARQVRASRGQA